MKATPHTIFFGFLIPFALFAACQNKKVQTDHDADNARQLALLIDSVAGDAYITTQSVARMAGTAPQYIRRQRLMELANEEQLSKMAAHPAGIIRLTAIEAMYKRQFDALLNTQLPQLLVDTDQVGFIQGDMLIQVPHLAYVYSYIFGLTLPGKVLPDGATPVARGYKPPDLWINQATRILTAPEDALEQKR